MTAPGNPASVSNPGKAAVLLIDDEQPLLALFAESLAPYFEVTIATSAREAGFLMHKKVFKVVVCDHLMPGGNGLRFSGGCAGGISQYATRAGYGLHETGNAPAQCQRSRALSLFAQTGFTARIDQNSAGCRQTLRPIGRGVRLGSFAMSSDPIPRPLAPAG